MLSGNPPERMRIGDILVARHTVDEVVALVSQRLSGPATAPLAVGSVNLDHLHHFRAGPAGIEGAPEWMWLADGAPVAWRGSRLDGRPWPRVTGADLLEPLLEGCAAHGIRVGFFGGLPVTHRRLAAVLAARYPTSEPARFWSPTREEIECPNASARLAAEIAAARVHLLVVGLGKPRQEWWIDRHGMDTGAGVLLAFGAAADFLAGVVKRAPDFYQRQGLEWLYRLRQEPRRLARRYLVQGPPAFLQLRHATLESGGVRPRTTAPPGRQP
ncbi:WecB/TagA/CpsF family glycosyltransferase [Mycobacterium sp. 21AC1]|uniref:WecB/TagA/CpsF family glycosyltransferase n=1 Tax=[Mycobacterium] appelbergii TaxID=2939269 RepID=UPI002938F94E|nr:WecB/TagA/CpsF family glycosyltransferase [Mycobacterium sp. 21AC1]MDV3125580.1 WecB/TagA/CpsF family glycosyltransferase [Mycobacterium sp. 21AC1]